MRAVSALVVAVTSAVALMAGAPSQKPEETARVVDVVAERFSFTPSEIRATVGIPLTIRLKSDDTDHGFHIVGANVDIEIPKRGRGTATVTFTPEKPGRYTFECSRLCGAGHAFMRGVIVAAEPAPEAR